MYFIVLFLTIVSTFAQDVTEEQASNCYLEGVTDFKWHFGYTNEITIEDVHSGIVKSFEAKNITSIEVTNGIYLDAHLTNDELIIITTEKFIDFERDIPTTNNKPITKLEIKLYCEEGERELVFNQPVKDTNNHEPVFSKDEYVFRYAMSIPANFFITDFYEIRAIDHDVSYNSLSFELEENEYLKVVGRVGDGKKYYPDIKTTKPVEIPFRKSFILKTTDSGTPSLSSTSNLTLLLIKPEDVIPNPVFTKPVYTANYNMEQNILEMSDEISLRRGEDDYELIQKNFKEYIHSKFEDGRIQIDVIKQFPEEIKNEEYAILNLELRHDFAFQRGRASVLIKFL